jgi:hypothetical protein
MPHVRVDDWPGSCEALEIGPGRLERVRTGPVWRLSLRLTFAHSPPNTFGAPWIGYNLNPLPI